MYGFLCRSTHGVRASAEVEKTDSLRLPTKFKGTMRHETSFVLVLVVDREAFFGLCKNKHRCWKLCPRLRCLAHVSCLCLRSEVAESCMVSASWLWPDFLFQRQDKADAFQGTSKPRRAYTHFHLGFPLSTHQSTRLCLARLPLPAGDFRSLGPPNLTSPHLTSPPIHRRSSRKHLRRSRRPLRTVPRSWRPRSRGCGSACPSWTRPTCKPSSRKRPSARRYRR